MAHKLNLLLGWLCEWFMMHVHCMCFIAASLTGTRPRPTGYIDILQFFIHALQVIGLFNKCTHFPYLFVLICNKFTNFKLFVSD